MSVRLMKKPIATQVSLALGLMFSGAPAFTHAAEAVKKADSGEIQSGYCESTGRGSAKGQRLCFCNRR